MIYIKVLQTPLYARLPRAERMWRRFGKCRYVCVCWFVCVCVCVCLCLCVYKIYIN